MDSELFIRLLRNLLLVPALKITDMEKELRSFEENSCFNNILQPMFTKEAMSFLLQSASSGTLYEIVDQLDVSVSFFSCEDELYLVGPYAKSEYSQKKMEKILLENKLPASNSIALKLYYTALPILYTNQVQNIINGCVIALLPNQTPFGYRRLSGLVRDTSPQASSDNAEAPDYSDIYMRYDAERQFLSTIKNGDVENVINTYKTMADNGLQSALLRSQNTYTNPAVSIAIVRALTRKAAEESGLSVITINEITQRYVQLTDSSRSTDEQMKLTMDMVLDLTRAVHDFKISKGKYSRVIQKTLEYIQYHLSEKLSLPELASNVDVSATYLSKQFKKETGKNLSEYISMERCKKAAEMLKSTDNPIQEISDYVGYFDNNYFVKVFKKYYGTTPSDYRA